MSNVTTTALHASDRSQLISAHLPPLMTLATINGQTSTLNSGDAPPFSATYPLKPLYAALRSRRQATVAVLSHQTVSRNSSPSKTLSGPTIHARGSPSGHPASPMLVDTTASHFTLKVCLPRLIRHEMITVYAKKGDRLAVIADAWHAGTDDCAFFRSS